MQEDGNYVRANAALKRTGFNAQDFLMHLSEGKVTLDEMPAKKGVAAD